MMGVRVITIDGPSGSGKGTISQLLAERLGWRLLDSGALYRVLAVAAERRGVAVDDEVTLEELACSLDVEFMHGDRKGAVRVLLEGKEVTDTIRSETCGSNASRVAGLARVRGALLERQRTFRELPGLVADGRDMGTVVFPDADLKIFLTASREERARRRYNQLRGKGINVNLATLLTDIGDRDSRDRDRVNSPLRPAEDAVVIDTTASTIDEVVANIMGVVLRRGLWADGSSASSGHGRR